MTNTNRVFMEVVRSGQIDSAIEAITDAVRDFDFYENKEAALTGSVQNLMNDLNQALSQSDEHYRVEHKVEEGKHYLPVVIISDTFEGSKNVESNAAKLEEELDVFFRNLTLSDIME